MGKVVLGVMLLLAGVSLLIVSIWLLVDTKVRNVEFKAGHSPKIGVAASAMLVISGILGCCVNKASVRRSLVIIGVILALGLTVACFGIAVKDRIDVDKIEQEVRGQMFGKLRTYGGSKLSEDLQDAIRKLKTQLIVMAVISGLDILVELSSLITACRWKDDYYP